MDAFIEHKRAIDALLAELAQRSADHFHTDPTVINWTDVAGLARLREALQDARDSSP
ncbi:hypothetical protein [Neogemmobacter tilapiae]|uniref:Uncharacterized protein n=1 Tax=Neogemmobacter tilapiae TaxID=875041 RepID=A0A918U0M7_9RHOB|nr:hypothetical protein [Gemmobacter tilapiae]GHC67670.1 hypothetical protein GCM10007315_35830 [Gemmobacter tilapiae]